MDGYTENPGDLSWKELDKLGELTVYERTSLTDQAEAIARIGDAELIFTNKTPITREVLNSCQQIRFIGVLATGELEHKTIGIIGFGRIGQSTGRIAKALGMKVLAYDVFPTESGRIIGEYVSLDELLKESDVIALHCNLTKENEKIICRENIEKMKDGVLLVNNARGQLVNEEDLAEALKSGKVAAAGLDVVSAEPIKRNNPLLHAPNCIITPHISWAPKESRQRIMECSVENAKAFLKGEPIHVVN